MTQPSPEDVPGRRKARSSDPSWPSRSADEPEQPSRAAVATRSDHQPSTTPTRQHALLVLAEVHPEARPTLDSLLTKISHETQCAMGGEPQKDALLPFQRLPGLHYARLVCFEDARGRPMLAFGTDYDGPEGEEHSARDAFELHLTELQRLATGLEQVFECCKGYRKGQLGRFLRRHRVAARTFYVGAPGRSCKQILWEAELGRRVRQLLAEEASADRRPEEIRSAIRERLLQERGRLPEFPAQPDLRGRFRWIVRSAVAGAAACLLLLVTALAQAFLWKAWVVGASLLGALGALIGLAVLRFRHLERTDPQFQPEMCAATHAELARHAQDENLFFQNQLTHLVSIKPGLLRWLLIRAVFTALQLRATYVYNRGKLGDIPSIHFARWALVPGRGVLFFSNFDSSWQSYLGDFIDKASAGLTAVWSNTVGYPRTDWLLRAGSRDAARFLAWTRHHQRPSQVWYCAYPGLSILSINSNTEVRRGLATPDSVDAATWLLTAQGVDRVSADKQYSDNQLLVPALSLDRIQGIILRGYGHMPHARYLLLRVRPGQGERARAWVGQLPLTSAIQGRRAEQAPEPLMNVAFSLPGLRALGVDEALCQRFATPFVQGAADDQRALINGDIGLSAPKYWQWGWREKTVHIVLLMYAKTAASADKYAAACVREADSSGLTCLHTLHGDTLPGRKEHFGFRDGIGQPSVQGCSEGDEANALPAGEFLLGYPDGYGNLSHAPQADNGFSFGHDGSYMVFRQLAQDVEGFWRHCAAQGGHDPAQAVAAAARCVGRWPSGASLVVHPDADPNDRRFEDEDNFSYLSNDEENDRYGRRCPFGAHIRRANPRDWNLSDSREESRRLSALHRIIRRGRPYGAPLHSELSAAHMLEAALASEPKTAPQRGLQFVCFNANIDRQFEFIQQHWCNNPSFSGLSDSPDPVLFGPNPLQRFVRVVGSGYFFMPSIPVVQLLGQGVFSARSAPVLEQHAADEQQYMDSLTTQLRNKMKRDYPETLVRRDAHPKMHGCVKAKFTILEVPGPLAVGLFAQPRCYQAWVRFSNQSGNAQHDNQRDIRGAAIKLLGVSGPKLLDGDEQCSTHDLVLISHDTFVTRDVKEFDALISATVRGKASLLGYLVRHPHCLRYLLRDFKRHTSVLDIEYHSATPYLLGVRAVRYVLRPTTPPPTSAYEGAKRGPNFLRERMRERLKQSSVSFDFAVQVAERITSSQIENPNARWPKAHVSEQVLATLTIDAQEFDTEQQRTFGENLTYNPWRCLPEHRPLGGVNRARRQIYRALSLFRHVRNATPQSEPEPDASCNRSPL